MQKLIANRFLPFTECFEWTATSRHGYHLAVYAERTAGPEHTCPAAFNDAKGVHCCLVHLLFIGHHSVQHKPDRYPHHARRRTSPSHPGAAGR